MAWVRGDRVEKDLLAALDYEDRREGGIMEAEVDGIEAGGYLFHCMFPTRH